MSLERIRTYAHLCVTLASVASFISHQTTAPFLFSLNGYLLHLYQRYERGESVVTAKEIGPFGGKVMNTENYRLAEIWITEKGEGYEFASGEFATGTGIIPSSGIRVLNKLVEAGVLGCYPDSRYKGRTLYRVAGTVTVSRMPAVVPTVAQEMTVVSESRMGTFSVALYGLVKGVEEEIYSVEAIQATSPREAAEKVRQSLSAVVTQTWEF